MNVQSNPVDDSMKSLYEKVQQTLRLWRTPNHTLPLATLASFQQNTHKIEASGVRPFVEDAVQQMSAFDAVAAEIIRARFFEGLDAASVGRRVHLGASRVYHRQGEAIAVLADIVAQREQAFATRRRALLMAKLPVVGETQLFGVTSTLAELCARLSVTTDCNLTSVFGLGGIGKTALVRAACQQMIDALQFYDVHWIHHAAGLVDSGVVSAETAAEQLLSQIATELNIDAVSQSQAHWKSQLTAALSQQRHLIVIDNIEHPAVAELLLTQLTPFAAHSHFVITTRVQPVTITRAFAIELNELTETDALALLRSEAAANNLAQLAATSNETLATLYKIVGGNPMMLKVTAGLARALPLDQLLDSVRHAFAPTVEQTYKHIFATVWAGLSGDAQQLLLAMPLVAEQGAKIEQMMRMAGLTKQQTITAIVALRERSLLDLHGAAAESRYSIHRLTNAFLQTDVNRWGGANDAV